MKLRTLSFTLAAILVVVAVAFLFGKPETTSWPSAASGQPSGLGAFAELLEQDGYKVSLDVSPYPRLRPGDIAIAARFSDASIPTNAELLERRINQTLRAQSPISRKLTTHMAAGGKVLIAIVPREFNESGTQPATYASTLSSESYKVDWNGDFSQFVTDEEGGEAEGDSPRDFFSDYSNRISLFTSDGGAILAEVQSVGKGASIHLHGGQILFNRSLDQAQHAEVGLALVRKLGPPGSRVVFTEASFGNQGEYSVFTILGPWAVAIRYQALLLFVVIAFTLSIRFGAQAIALPRTRGARDAIDAIAGALRSPKRRAYALQVLLTEAEGKVRRALNASPDLPLAELMAASPPSLAEACRNVRDAVSGGRTISSKEAVLLAATLQREVAQVERARTSQGSRTGMRGAS